MTSACFLLICAYTTREMCPLSACLVQALSHAGTPWEEPVAPIPPPAPAGAPPPPVPGDLSWWVALTRIPCTIRPLVSRWPRPVPEGHGDSVGALHITWRHGLVRGAGQLCVSAAHVGLELGCPGEDVHAWLHLQLPHIRDGAHSCHVPVLLGSVGPFGLRALCSAGHSLSLPTHLGCGCPAPLGASRKVLRRAVAPSALSLSSSSVYSPEIPI